MTIVNVNLQGNLERCIKEHIRAGYAATKAEVIRSALKEYFGLNKKVDRIDEDLKFAMAASEEVLKEVWDSDKEEAVWSKYY